MAGQRKSSDDLVVDYIFVPDGAPPPVAWLAAHPGSFSVPAWFVPERPPSVPDHRASTATAPIAAGPGPHASIIADAAPSTAVPSLAYHTPAGAVAAAAPSAAIGIGGGAAAPREDGLP